MSAGHPRVAGATQLTLHAHRMRRVVITGIGIVSPLGIGAKRTGRTCSSGKSAPSRRSPPSTPPASPARSAARCRRTRSATSSPRATARRPRSWPATSSWPSSPPTTRSRTPGLKSQAYTETPDFDGTRFGCNIGAGLISCDLNELTAAITTARDERANQPRPQELGPRRHAAAHAAVAAEVPAQHAGLPRDDHARAAKGRATRSPAPTPQSHLAIGEAFRTIQRGEADLAICGGAESKVNPMGLIRQCLLKRLTETHNDAPEQAVRPFDADAGGTAIARGRRAASSSKSTTGPSRAARRSTPSWSASAPARTPTGSRDPDPTGHALWQGRRRRRLADANLPPTAVDLIVPNGLGIAESRPRRARAACTPSSAPALARIPLRRRSRPRPATSPPAAASMPPTRRAWPSTTTRVPAADQHAEWFVDGQCASNVCGRGPANRQMRRRRQQRLLAWAAQNARPGLQARSELRSVN